ncbi:unnamed protein product [Caretta caretta]
MKKGNTSRSQPQYIISNQSRKILQSEESLYRINIMTRDPTGQTYAQAKDVSVKPNFHLPKGGETYSELESLHGSTQNSFATEPVSTFSFVYTKTEGRKKRLLYVSDQCR